MSRLKEICDPANVLVVSYERLVAESVPVLRELCAFLGEEWDGMLLTRREVQQNRGTEDPVSRGTWGFRPNSGSWKGLIASEKERLETVGGSIRGELDYGA